MGFQSGLSGLNSATKNLDIIGNNIANAQTVGMKSSRAEFSALVSSALGAGDTAGSGIGVSVAAVTQQFSQGNINITGNNLDVAINGTGFLQVKLKDDTLAYTRDGQLKLDNQGNIVTNSGAKLLGFPIDSTTRAATSATPVPLSVPTGSPLPAKQTTKVTAEFNLPGQSVPAASTSPPTPMEKYATSINAFDSQGVPVPATLYFVNVGTGTSATATDVNGAPLVVNRWAVFSADTKDAGYAALLADAATNAPIVVQNDKDNKANAALNATDGGVRPTYANGGIVPPTFGTLVAAGSEQYILEFDAGGKIIPPTAPLTLTLKSNNIAVGTLGSFDVTLDIASATQFGTAFSVTDLTQDGYTAGDLTSINIDEAGFITTVYSNGQSQINSQISLADFRNVQGLTPVGAGNWVETGTSGQPIQGAPGDGKFGNLRSGALEESNVDLTAELVNMMTAQRSYQANVQTIKTQDQALQSLVNLR